jgi:hypothetical protein
LRGCAPWLLAAVLVLASPAVYAQAAPEEEADWGDEEDGDWGEEDSGFDSSVFDASFSDVKLAAPSDWSLTGFARSAWGLWTERLEDEPWAKGRQSLDLEATYKKDGLRGVLAGHAEYDLRYLHQRDLFDDATLEAYEWQVLGREMFVAYSWERVEVTLGRQIVAWGEGDALSPLDVVNPRDLREPGVSDLEDIRLAVLASRLGYFVGDHRLELMVIHEAEFGLRSPPFGPYSPLPELLASDPTAAALLGDKTIRFADEQERFAGNTQQVLARWVYKGPGIDLGVLGGYVLDKQGVIGDLVDLSDPAALAAFAGADEVNLNLDHQHYGVVGTSGARAWGSVLLKWELGLELDRPLNVQTQGALGPEFGVVRTDLIQTMAGLSWTPEPEILLALEVLKPFRTETIEDLLFDIDEPTLALRFSWRGLNERLTVGGGASALGLQAEQGWLVGVDASYEAVQSLFVALGYTTIHPGESFGFLSGLDTHDQLTARLRYDFTIH